MNARPSLQTTSVDRFVKQAQSRWTLEERRQRAASGRRKSQKLLRLLAASQGDTDVWAIGSVAPSDVLRLVG